MLPNLSKLSIGTTLFDFLISKGAAKEPGCTRHKEPVENKEDEVENCAIEGYLMYLPLARRRSTPASVPRNADLYVNVAFASGTTSTVTLKWTAKKAINRFGAFERREKKWVENTFERVCERPNNATIHWDEYGETLMLMTEYYYLDPDERGHLFICTYMDEESKQKAHMPFKRYAKGPYLFVALVCAESGFGKDLMNIAKEAAYALGCSGIALASLSNSAGFYYSLGYRFVSRSDGGLIDARRFTKQETIEGVTKTMLLTEEADAVKSQSASKKRKYQENSDCSGSEDACVVSVGPS